MSRLRPLKPRWKQGIAAAGLAALFILISFAAVNLVLNRYPGAGAQGIDLMRQLLGDKTAAQVESAVFRAEDVFHQWRYQINGKLPVAPWGAAPGSQGVYAGQMSKREIGRAHV